MPTAENDLNSGLTADQLAAPHHLLDVHNALRQELTQVRDIAAQVLGLEDRSIFPHLRRADPGLEPVLDRLIVEHEVIAEVLDQLDRALVALVGEEPTGRKDLRHAIDLLTDTLLSHLAWEEKVLWRPLAEHSFY